MGKDLSKEQLYEAVKTLLEAQAPHLILDQHKLFTLFSLAFQYLLFRSIKDPGAYILRIEDSQLADRLAKKSKDSSTRKFMQSLLVPRKLKYQKSMFYLDFFHVGSWNHTSELTPDKIKAAVIVKNPAPKPMDHLEEAEGENIMASLPPNYFLQTLMEVANRTITIAFEGQFTGLEPIRFPFVTKDKEKTISGVTLGNDIDWDKIS